MLFIQSVNYENLHGLPPSVRKQHNAGYKHKANVRSYYQQFEEAQTQNFIEQKIKEHLGQTAAFQQVGAAYNQHLMVQRPRLPVLPTPIMPMPGSTQLPGSSPLVPGIRPLVLPRPLGASGYMPSPAVAPMMAPPGAPSLPAQLNPIPRPPGSVATTVPGSTAAPTSSNGAPPMVTPPLYQANPVALTGK
nr:u1 small nuclear ribonucleoprotein c [Quercus suber]